MESYISDKLNKFDVRGAIRFECQKGDLTIREIAKKYGVNKSTVMKWKKRESPLDKKRIRKSKYGREHIRYIYKLGVDKFTGIQGASSRKIRNKFNKKFGGTNGITISQKTTNTILGKILSKPRRSKKTFKITERNRESRSEFSAYVIDKTNRRDNIRIKGEEIFFTDEKRFLLDTPLNKQCNQIRFCKKSIDRLNNGDPKIYEKLYQPLPKFTTGFMVAGGLSCKGVSKLIFCVGTMDSNAYLKTLDYFKEDIERLNKKGLNLMLQQDNASSHTAKVCLQRIESLFGDRFLKHWPANSPDLSPIETLWAIVQNKLQGTKYSNLEEMKQNLVKLWNRIPVKLCEKLVKSFNKKIDQVEETNGERYNRKKDKKPLNHPKVSNAWKTRWNLNDSIERVTFNNSTLEENRQVAIKVIRKKIKLLNKHFKSEIQPKYKPNFIKSMKMSVSRGKAYEQKGKQEESDFKNKVIDLENEIERISNMELDDWYNSLNEQRKIKMIKEIALKKFDFDDQTILTTNIDDNYENELSVSVLSRSSFDSKEFENQLNNSKINLNLNFALNSNLPLQKKEERKKDPLLGEDLFD